MTFEASGYGDLKASGNGELIFGVKTKQEKPTKIVSIGVPTYI